MWIFKKTIEMLAVKQPSIMTHRLNNLLKILKALKRVTQTYLKKIRERVTFMNPCIVIQL